MDVTINGKPRTIDKGDTILKMLESLNISPEGVIVEHNGRILKRPLFNEARVEAGDRLELIQIVGGG